MFCLNTVSVFLLSTDAAQLEHSDWLGYKMTTGRRRILTLTPSAMNFVSKLNGWLSLWLECRPLKPKWYFPYPCSRGGPRDVRSFHLSRSAIPNAWLCRLHAPTKTATACVENVRAHRRPVQSVKIKFKSLYQGYYSIVGVCLRVL